MANMRERIFTLHLCCGNCLRPSLREVVVPAVDDAPYDVESFLESGLLPSLAFRCLQCESPIGTIVAVTMGGDSSEIATPEGEAENVAA